MNRFTKEFKEKAIVLKEKGTHPNKIFEDEGFCIKGRQKEYAGKLISRWKKSLPQLKEKDTQKKIEYLEAKVAYLEAERDFLKQLPKKKKN